MSGMFWIALELSIPKIGFDSTACYLKRLKNKTRLNLTESRNLTTLFKSWRERV